MILLQELFETPYFCKDHLASHFDLARPVAGNPVLRRFQALARELEVVLPISFFERANNAYFNSLAMIDADGAVLGVYRKSHIPEGPGYHEKFYFSPGDTGFRVWRTRYGTLGVGICWDQWFPEAARCMALMGAEILLYPTAIGSEPQDASIDSRDHWQRCMQGHAAANVMPLVASNRIGDGARREVRDDVLRLVVHRRPDGRQGRRGRPLSRRRADGDVRPRRCCARSGMPGACSATGGPSSIAPILTLDGHAPA